MNVWEMRLLSGQIELTDFSSKIPVGRTFWLFKHQWAWTFCSWAIFLTILCGVVRLDSVLPLLFFIPRETWFRQSSWWEDQKDSFGVTQEYIHLQCPILILTTFTSLAMSALQRSLPMSTSPWSGENGQYMPPASFVMSGFLLCSSGRTMLLTSSRDMSLLASCIVSAKNFPTISMLSL